MDLLFDCPRNSSVPACPFSKVRELNDVVERVNWLKGLPLLRPTDVLPLPASGRWENQTKSGQNKLSPGPKRAGERSRTYPGIAAAMADQWGDSP